MNDDNAAGPTMPAGAFSLPARYFTDPERYQSEIERYFYNGWIHAGRVEELAAPGDHVLRNVGGESLIVVRGQNDALRAFYNVCRHRGTRLCESDRGSLGDLIRCPYHAWAYDLTGRLVAAPQMEGVPGFRCEDYPLISVAAENWEGHLFLHLGQSVESLHARLAQLTTRFQNWGMEGLRLGERVVYDVAANWKLIIQNYSECLHCPGVHPALQRLSHFLSGDNEPANPVFLGGRMQLRSGVETMTMDGRSSRACLPGLRNEELSGIYYYTILPNLLLSLHPDYMMTHTLWPRAVDRTEIVCEWHFHPDERDSSTFNPGDAVQFWDLTNRQDWHVCEQMQLGVSSRAYRPGPYSNREGLLRAFDQLVQSDVVH